MLRLSNYTRQRLSSLTRGDSLKAQLVRGAVGVGGLKLLSLPLTLVTSILLARGLGPEGYGQFSFIMAVITILSLPVGKGLGQLVTREVAEYHHGADWGLFRGLLRRANQWVVLGSAIMASIIALLAARNASWTVDDRWTLLLVATLLLPMLGLNELRRATLRGLRNVFYAQIPELLARPGLHLVIVSSLLVAGLLNPATALASQVVATAMAFGIGAGFLLRLQPAEVPAATPDYRHGEWGQALPPFILLVAASTLNGQIGILALGWLSTDEEVAALRVAQNGAMMVALSLTIVNQVIGPQITRACQDNDQARLQRLSRESARGALAVALPIALPLIFLGDPILDLVFGAAYRDSASLPLAILAIGQLINVLFGSVGIFLTMSGYERDTLIGQILALAVNAIAAVLFIPSLGAIGAALAVTIGLATWNTVLGILFMKRLGLRPSAL